VLGRLTPELNGRPFFHYARRAAWAQKKAHFRRKG
jgi:hypothetical protein